MEKSAWWQRVYRFRTGIEGRISVLRRKYGLQRCLYRSEAGMERWIGWGIQAHNLSQDRSERRCPSRVDRRKRSGAKIRDAVPVSY
jgi:hypothetical protein